MGSKDVYCLLFVNRLCYNINKQISNQTSISFINCI